MTPFVAIATVHEFTGHRGDGTSQSWIQPQQCCMRHYLLSVYCSEQKKRKKKNEKIVDVSLCVTNGRNMCRLSFTQNEREECDKIGRSSPLPHHH